MLCCTRKTKSICRSRYSAVGQERVPDWVMHCCANFLAREGWTPGNAMWRVLLSSTLRDLTRDMLTHTVPEKPWNTNVQYHHLLLRAIPDGAKRVIDVGCGNGILRAELLQQGVKSVVGVYTHASVIEPTRTRFSGLPIEYTWRHSQLGFATTAPITRCSFGRYSSTDGCRSRIDPSR